MSPGTGTFDRLKARIATLPPAVRIVTGVLLCLFGLVGFLPILGFWMLPLGLLVLSYDLPFVRRARRRFQVWWARRRAAD